nr:Chain C, RY0808 peptide [Gallus gallus]6LHF_F Chain F, RY0808 peptide [Gallus gallus]6LHH_C Chain C, ARG-ARG-ARG-GLU-GLN-THR-ASP-TYR [Gallus gallus]7WBG_C Chain C, ARG-ARG-ARG-GLU-GLN-THR-ASP-TYR [uncultured virus]7WBG_F Chain F, ARG-ARG-ARG-GLU-GLN-THR-ASP-TYR [uncultured virus]
RRREQTDY